MNTKSLKETDIKHILKLEELFYNKFLNQELLNQLVSLYVKAIDCCSKNLSLMKIYFLQKMQFLLSRPQIEKLLTDKESENSTRDKYTIKISNLELEYEAPQYVRKSSLHSQPVGRKLAQMTDEDQKIRQRENRIKVQLELLRQIESSLNQIPLQRRKKQSNYLPSKTTNQLDFEDEKLHIKEKITNKTRKIRKNSDCFKNKKQIQEFFDGKTIPKQYLVSIQEQINLKLSNIILKGKSNPEQTELTIFKRRRFELRSTYNNEEQAKFQQIQTDCVRNDSNLENVPIFYSFSYGTFAQDHNTPEFSTKDNTPINSNIHFSFSQPIQESTDTSIISSKTRPIGVEKQLQDQKRPINDDQSEDDYMHDEYF